MVGRLAVSPLTPTHAASTVGWLPGEGPIWCCLSMMEQLQVFFPIPHWCASLGPPGPAREGWWQSSP